MLDAVLRKQMISSGNGLSYSVSSLYKLYPSSPILVPERNSEAQHVEIATSPKIDFCRPIVT